MKIYILATIAMLGLSGCYSNANIGGSIPIGQHGVGSSSVGVDSNGNIYTHAGVGVGGYL